MMSGNKYKEKVSDDSLINLIESGVMNSTGEWLNSSDMTKYMSRMISGSSVMRRLASHGIRSLIIPT